MIHREKIDALDEKEILYNLIFSEKFCREICPIIDYKLFEVDYVRLLVSYIKSYYDEFKINPDKNIIKIFRSHLDEINDENLKENVLIFIKKLDENFDESTFNADYSIQRAIKYLKKQSIKNLNLELDSYITTGDIDKAENRITKYKTIEKNSGEAISLLNSPEYICNAYTDEESTLFDIQGAYGKVIGDIHREDFISFLSPMKRGKCLAKGTKILMYDGSIKEVQDLEVGDKLMGDDFTPRNVISTSTGFGKMYKIMNKEHKINFTCNGDHILVLRNKLLMLRNKYKDIEISVNDYLKLSKVMKKRLMLIKRKKSMYVDFYPFTVEDVGEDNYYGFVIDGNHRFLLDNGIVSHNTFALIDVSCRALFYGLKVLFVSLEMSEQDVSKRFYTALTKDIKTEKDIEFSYLEFNGNKYEVKHRIIHKKPLQLEKIQKRLNSLKRMFRKGDVRILAVPSYSLSPSQLDDKIDKLIQQEQFVPDVITIDYADIMAVQSNNEYRHQIDDIWKRLRGLAQKRKAVVFTASQSTRASLSRDVESEDLAEDIRKLAHVTSMVAINQTQEERKNGIVRFKQLALREGEQEFRQAVCTQCLPLGSMVTDSCFDDEINLNNNTIQRKNTKN